MKILDESRLTMVQAARRARVHVATIWRWALCGVRGHKLIATRIGGRRYILERDLDAFIAALNNNPDPDIGDFDIRADVAGKRLDALGVNVNRSGSHQKSSTSKRGLRKNLQGD